MIYKIVVVDLSIDERIEKTVEAESVFDAIDKVSIELENAEDTELIEAYPIL